ncbi:MAG: ACT domain-containing protein [Elusimicrobiota bacterium]|nr:ACT domain-containing protein [Elusimicrobiota bacterium]
MKAIVTVIGKDQTGIIARISACLYNENVNIEDINQTIMQNNFTMIMFVDLSKAKNGIEVMQEKLDKLGKEIGISIRIQNETIFQAMHRI